MIRKTIRIASVVVAASVAVVAPAKNSGAGPDCSGWRNAEFWQAAAAEDVERCFAADAKINARHGEGWTLLHLAAAFGKTATVNALIAAGAEVDARDKQGMTPLLLAMRWIASADNVKALIAAGAEVDVRHRRYRVTPLHIAAGAYKSTMVKAMIAAGAKVDARNNKGWTPLHYAAYAGEAESIIALLDAGASTAARTDSGDTAFDLARKRQAKKLRGTDAWQRLRDVRPK